MTIEQYTAITGETVTPEQEPILRFLRERKVKGKPAIVFYAWGLVDEAMLDTPIAQPILDQVYGEGKVVGLTLRDFCLNWQAAKEEGKVVFTLSANFNVLPKAKGRKPQTTIEDGLQWFGFTAFHGVTPENALDIEQYQEEVAE